MYKELDPSDRLLLLKALCEVRADVILSPVLFLQVFASLIYRMLLYSPDKIIVLVYVVLNLIFV